MEETWPDERARRFGEWLRQLREARNLDARYVSRLIGASKGYVSALEAGKILDPSFPLMMKLSRIYHVEPSEMIERIYGVRVEELISSQSQLHEAMRRLGYPEAVAYQMASLIIQLAPKPPGSDAPGQA